MSESAEKVTDLMAALEESLQTCGNLPRVAVEGGSSRQGHIHQCHRVKTHMPGTAHMCKCRARWINPDEYPAVHSDREQPDA